MDSDGLNRDEVYCLWDVLVLYGATTKERHRRPTSPPLKTKATPQGRGNVSVES